MSNLALLVEDNSSHAELISDELELALAGWELEVAPTLAEARRRMAERKHDLYVFDFRLPDGDGLELLREIRAAGVETPTLFVTTASSARLAVEAMKLGADDFVVKEEGYLSILPVTVAEVLKHRRLAAERRALEERLQRAEKADVIRYLGAGLAHHINNPLATIRTFLQLVPMRLDDEEFLTKYRETAIAESDRIRNLVLTIMRATTIPVEGYEVQRFEEILALAEEDIERQLDLKGLRCVKRLPSELPAVRVHGEAVKCLLLTLLENAVRFSPEGAEIEVDAKIDADRGRMVVVIRDHGPGVPPEHVERIFEPFFTTAVDGLGMGLWLASRIADLQDIELRVENRLPHGAAFIVGLPLAGQEALQQGAA